LFHVARDLGVRSVDANAHIGTETTQNNVPKDLISLLAAVKDCMVSRSTLKRAIADGRLKSYRPRNAAQNAPHKVSRTDVVAIWPRRN
jgi:hypothetical protein